MLAIVEIEPQLNGKPPGDLLRAAYLASRRGCIGLVLNHVMPMDIDREIDSLVAGMPLDIPGLLYVDRHDTARLGSCIATASMIFISRRTELFWRSVCINPGGKVCPSGMALETLRRIARPVRLSDMQFARSQSGERVAR